jgi:hypothetical protein
LPRTAGRAWRAVARADRDVVLGLARHDLRPRFGAVGERELDLGRVGDDVEAGQDVAIQIDDDPATEAGAGGLVLGRG